MRPDFLPSLALALKEGAQDLLEGGELVAGVRDPTSIGSRFGVETRRTYELVGHTFALSDPAECIVGTPARAIRLPFAIAQWIWTMSGSDELEPISHYNSAGQLFSPDGTRLPGSFGWRLRGSDRTDQLRDIVARLTVDPQSRRAVAVIAEPKDAHEATRDHPCGVALQYLLRDGRLDAITYMRSQSAAMVLPYDGFLFMALQCWLAACLDAEPGIYRHFSGSFHIYEDELEVAETLAEAEPLSVRIGPMPNPESELADLIKWEQKLRRAVAAGEAQALEHLVPTDLRPDTFWDQARAVLSIEACSRLGAESLFERARSGLDPQMCAILNARDEIRV